MRERTSLVSLNRGLVSRLGLARIDLKRLALAAEVMVNWIPRVLGPMSLRQGWKYITSTLSNRAARCLKFIFATDDTALLELTHLAMRVFIDDVLLTRPAVTAAVTNGSFTSDLTGWTDSDDGGATSQWVAPGYLELVGSGTARAIRDQQVTLVESGIEHALRVIIARGPVTIRVGNASGDDSYIAETTLFTGEHSLSFTPTTNFWIRFSSTQIPKVWVDSCLIESAGTVTLPTPWTGDELGMIRYDQSADVIFAACDGHQQRRIERRGTSPGGRSWSVCLYQASNGPFKIQNLTATTITPSATTGNVTLTASVPYFKASHVGGLFSVTSVGQTVTATAGTFPVPTASIRVFGAGPSRIFSWTVTGFGTATVDLQRSYDNLTWVNVGGGYSWTADVSSSLDDMLTNQIVYYRLNTSAWSSGSIVMSLFFSGGSIRGIARVTGFTSSTVVDAEVVSQLGGTTASTTWQEGQWSDRNGWPTAVRLHEGRLWWSGQNGIWGSISDAYDSFDETFPGDAGPINRTIGSGPVDTINWMLSMRGLLLGAQGAELTARSSSLDEPLTPTNFNVKAPSTQGSGSVDAVKVDQMGYFVNRSNCKIFELAFEVKAYDYNATDLFSIVPEIGYPGIVRIDVQRQPETRLHCVRSDGTVVLGVMNKIEDVLAWVEIGTSGFVEDVCVLPAADGDLDDRVYYIVRRVINGATVRYVEKWAQEIDCRGDQQWCDLGDAHVRYSGAATTTITGLSHLEGQAVTVWADGHDLGTEDSVRPWTQRYTVSGGQITLGIAVSNATVGLPYQAPFKSTKLGSITQSGSPLNMSKSVSHLGLICADMHPKGLRFGDTLDETGSHRMDDMPAVEDGAIVGVDTITAYDQNLIPFPGTWTPDTRVCLMAQAPRPCTVLGITPDMDMVT